MYAIVSRFQTPVISSGEISWILGFCFLQGSIAKNVLYISDCFSSLSKDICCIIYREVFHVMEEMLAVPKLYVPISTCMLRVINNDTGEEIPRVFQKVAPYVYKKNRVSSLLVLDFIFVVGKIFYILILLQKKNFIELMLKCRC